MVVAFAASLNYSPDLWTPAPSSAPAPEENSGNMETTTGTEQPQEPGTEESAVAATSA